MSLASDVYIRLENLALGMIAWFVKLVKGSRPEDMGAYRQFVRFCAVGVLNTIIGWGIYYIFIIINTDYYLIGNVVGFVVSVLNAYFWSRRYVFEIKNDNRGLTLVKTFISYGLTLGLSTVLLYITVDMMHISAFIAPVICMLVTIPLNFILNKFWAYKQRPE